MALFDEVFPPDSSEVYVQTQWTSSWSDVEAGFGYAAELLTKQSQDFGAAIDQAGLAIFFLQRHRVELALKGLLHAVAADVPSTHSLSRLWSSCRAALEDLDKRTWQEFEIDGRELVDVLDRVDTQSSAFRYPVDRSGQAVVRPPYIDLDALNRHVDRFTSTVEGYVDYLAQAG